MGAGNRPGDAARLARIDDARPSPDPATGRRLDGWKSIAAYFKRDRSTVMRWAAERDLPVRRMPGGSVFAFEADLAAWSTDPATSSTAPSVPAVADDPPPREHRSWSRITLLAGSALAIAATAWLSWRSPAAPVPYAMPTSPVVAQTFVQARDTWARRTPADIRRSIELYRDVIRHEPGFAPAYVGLAESWLVNREYGDVGDRRAYGQARAAATRALALDPTLPAAHRAMGFVHYWWDNDPGRALADFQRALELDGRDAQTHFWYANVLADLGWDSRAQEHYDRARLILPGSSVIAVEHACSQALAGRVAMGRARLHALALARPGDPTIHGCLAWIATGAGDIAATAREYGHMARLRGEPGLASLSAELAAAVRNDPATAHRVLIADARREIASGARRLRQTPAYVASAMGDRAELIVLLREAIRLEERWYTASMTAAIAQRWGNDPEVMALLSRVRQPRPTLPA